MQVTQPPPHMLLPRTIDAALDALARPGAVAVAGATWVMRTAPRPGAPVWVALSGIAPLHPITEDAEGLRIGAMATHAQLARHLADMPELGALAQAAGQSANPGVRNLATLGGNLCTSDFAAADLVPALLALDAAVSIATPQGHEALPVAAFLERRAALGPYLLTSVSLPRRAQLSVHERLTIRRAGDYPIAALSIGIERAPGGEISHARFAVGALEGTARRWPAMEAAVRGTRPDPSRVESLAQARLGGFVPRDGLDAPGWYRLRILPTLARRAFEQLEREGNA